LCNVRTAAPAAVHAAAEAVDGLEAAECPSGKGGERKHGRLPPHNARGRKGCQRHRRDLAVGAGLIGVDLEEHVADAQGRALTMGDDNLDLHAGHYCGRAMRGVNADTFSAHFNLS
jgi:hypothetical protein